MSEYYDDQIARGWRGTETPRRAAQFAPGQLTDCWWCGAQLGNAVIPAMIGHVFDSIRQN